MTASAKKESSQEWEAIFDLPLTKALRLAKEPRDLLDKMSDIMVRTDVDRLLIASLDGSELTPESFEPAALLTESSIKFVLLDLATRLVVALEEIRELVKQDYDRENARGIVRMARAEGRIPAEDA